MVAPRQLSFDLRAMSYGLFKTRSSMLVAHGAAVQRVREMYA